MDNRITKKRLSDALSYDWIKIIVITLAVIIVWEFVYTVTATRLTSGQNFKLFFDQNIVVGDAGPLMNKLSEDKAFSFDILEINSENLIEEQNLLSLRIQVDEGDIIFTDNVDKETTIKNGDIVKENRAKTIVDDNPIYSFEKLIEDAKNYLTSTYFIDGKTQIALENIDDSKVESVFRQRMKKDNRFRKEEQIQQGIPKEKERVEKLVNDIIFMQEFIEKAPQKYGEDIFMRYTRYELKTALFPDDQNYKQLYQMEKGEFNRENLIYGIDLGKLTGGKENVSSLVKVSTNKDQTTADNVIMMVINLQSAQPHLQYETLSFMKTIIINYSDFTIEG